MIRVRYARPSHETVTFSMDLDLTKQRSPLSALQQRKCAVERLAPSSLHVAPLLEDPLLGTHRCLLTTRNCQKQHQHN